MDDIAPEANSLANRAEEIAIGLVLLRAQGKRNIVGPRGEIECGLVGVLKDVKAGLSEVCVLSGVENSMVVIPQCTGTLIIILVGALI